MIFTLLAAIIVSRGYWPVDPVVFASSGSVHTHVKVAGWVNYTKWEKDGDLHMKIVPIKNAATPFFIAECIPALPCVRPDKNAHVAVSGISRRDQAHKWWEVHPCEKIEVLN